MKRRVPVRGDAPGIDGERAMGQFESSAHAGAARQHASSGPDWEGRYGRRPRPMLKGDRDATRRAVVERVLDTRRSLEARGRFRDSQYLAQCLERWLKRRDRQALHERDHPADVDLDC